MVKMRTVKIMIVLAVVFASYGNCFSQMYIDMTIEEVLTEAPNAEFKINDNGEKYLTWKDRNNATLRVSFKGPKSFSSILIPATPIEFNKLVTRYNSGLVKISDKEWKHYLGEKVITIKVIYIEQMFANAFYYTLSK